MASKRNPKLYLIGGPNGAGKTTSARALLPELLKCDEYVNADGIAAGISPFRPNEVSIHAGKIMLRRIKELAAQKRDFAFETTMASRTFAVFLRNCKAKSYDINLVFIWLQDMRIAIERVELRVKSGGHWVSKADIRRRYRNGISNFFRIYMPLADNWTVFDNSDAKPVLVARKFKGMRNEVLAPSIWKEMEKHK